MKKQEELQTRLEKLRREAKQSEIVDMQEAKLAEKKIDGTKVSNSCVSSLRSI